MRRKVFVRKNKAIYTVQVARHGINVKKTFIRAGKEYLFDPIFDEKPTLRSWIGRAKDKLLGLKDLPGNESDPVISFMNKVRSALWVGPSFYERTLLQHIMLEGDLSA